MKNDTTYVQGLTDKEVELLQQQWGKNKLRLNEAKRLVWIGRDIITEPMFILLAVACAFYFILGEVAEGFMMMAAIVFVSAISVYQEVKSANALAALQSLTEPKAKVIRGNVQKCIPLEEIVPGDLIKIDEGDKVPADAILVHCHDLTVNEAILTGEAFPVAKSAAGNNHIYQGTVVNSGSGTAKVFATGSRTELGKLGKSIATYVSVKSELQQRIDVFVKALAIFGLVAFVLIAVINIVQGFSIATSLMYGLTLAMSAIPEEIPVAFSSFMALGAYAIAKLGVITRQPQVIENLGAVDVICLDKTGTITTNKITVDTVYHFAANETTIPLHPTSSTEEVLYYALLASEKSPFDIMEKAIATEYLAAGYEVPAYPVVKEYALQGSPPMMTHVYKRNSDIIAAAKGGLERVLSVCHLSATDEENVLLKSGELAAVGRRIIGVAKAVWKGDEFPVHQDDFNWVFVGFLAFSDPPKPYIQGVLQAFFTAGIRVKMLTGDHLQTAASIAEAVGLPVGRKSYSGENVMRASEKELRAMVRSCHLFYRMFPEAKLRVIRALQQNQNIVAMTGDGVNDGPALAAADIGIAIGKSGTEVARQAADLILTDDDLRKITEAIRQGRKIFANLKKAVRYIVSIHIPILLIASLPLLLGWKYANLFTPIHIIFLELIMGPTCSIFYEQEPVEPNSMQMPPRKKQAWLFEPEEIAISIVQGLAITLGVLMLNYFYTEAGASISEVRSVVFITLLLSNILLTFVNRSFQHTILQTLRYKNRLVLPILALTAIFLFLLLLVPAVQELFGLAPISGTTFFICLLTALFSVGWFELYKADLRLVAP